MIEALQIRRFQATDSPSIIDITNANFNSLKNPAEFNWSAESIEDELSKVPCWVAETHQQIVVGFLCYRDLLDYFEISVLATRPEYKKKGVQIELIQSLQIDAAKQKRGVILEVHEQNEPAKALYLKMGFQQINKRKAYYSDGSAAVIMKWGP